MKNIYILLFMLFALNASAQLPGNSLVLQNDGEFVEVPDPLSNIPSNNMTIEAWVYYCCSNGSSFSEIVSKGWCATSHSIQFDIIDGNLSFSKFHASLCQPTAYGYYKSVNKVVPFNTWTHVAAVITNATDITLYVNGQEVPKVLVEGIASPGIQNSNQPLRIGTYMGYIGNFATLRGQLDEVRIWHTARTQSEIVANMNTPLSGNENGLFCYYKFDETSTGAGQTVLNSATATGATYNGTTVGTATNPYFISNATPVACYSGTPTGSCIPFATGPLLSDCSDDFNGTTINSNWILINPNPASEINLTGQGEMHLKASALNGGSDLWAGSNFNAPRILRAVDTSNHTWTVETKLRFSPSGDYQDAGIIVYGNSTYTPLSATRTIVRQYSLAFGSCLAATGAPVVPYTDSIVYFRLQRSLDSIRSWYSHDGIVWNYMGGTAGLPIFYVGLHSVRQPWNGNTNLHSDAYFDYFNFYSYSPCSTVLNLNLFIEGYYIGSNAMTPVMMNEDYTGLPTPTINDVDDIMVELHNNTSPYNVVATTTARLKTNGTATCTFPALSGNYYIVVKHRNAIETWSASPISISSVNNYDFTTAANNAYGNNLKLMPDGVYALYSGDIKIDGNIDLLDKADVESDINSFVYGYYSSDINGDGNVDLIDTPILENNITNFIFTHHP